MKKVGVCLLAAVIVSAAFAVSAGAKTIPAGQTVGDVLFYVGNGKGDEILVSEIPVSDMEADMAAGKIDDTLHNYSVLDRFTTTVHQEAQGFTVQDFVAYAKSKSSVAALRSLPFAFGGDAQVRFWEIDQTGYDDLDSYRYADLYDVERWNFPALYGQWNYETQEYKDVNAIWESRQPETVMLSVRAFSQRYMITEEKFGVDYNMESYWHDSGLLDNQRTIRIMMPMTREDLFNKQPTASDTRYWVANILLNANVAYEPLGRVAAPTATMTESGDNLYIRFSCATEGATVLYNHNFISPSYTPTAPYDGNAVVVPKSFLREGALTMTARAVKEGYTDEGVVTLTLRPSGSEANPVPEKGAWSDVTDGAWYADAADYVMGKGLFDEQGNGKFAPGAPMTRAMLVTALYRLAGEPPVTDFTDFSDITRGSPLSAAAGWAAGAGVSDGVGNGAFAPDSSITREQIAAMFYRYTAGRGAAVSAKGDLSAFTDSGRISAWALEALTWANVEGLINGMGDGTVAPQGTATRAQVAQIMLNYAQ